MQIKEYRIDRDTIEGFADKNGLIMEVHERTHVDSPERFYAHFENAEVKDGIILIGNFGNGHTPKEAIENYAKEISGKLLVIRAMSKKNRREIYVPVLVT